MSGRCTRTSGHTLVEMLIALAISAVVVVAATGGWIHVLRVENKNDTQMELDLDVRKSMDNLKHDLRLSAMNRIYYYPPGPGPYTAISFPIARDDDHDGLVEMASDGSNIQWDATVVYHVWGGTPNKLLRTVFDPRDNTLTDVQRQAQLASVVTRGSGTNWSDWTTRNLTNSSTRTLFENMLTNLYWASSATYDAYAPEVSRDLGVVFGSVYLTPGLHQFRFRSLGKNPLSSGCKIGVDTLTASPSSCAVEGESMVPPYSRSNGTASASYMTQGSWSGNYQFLFDNCLSNDSFTLQLNNDQWRETNFRGVGADCKRTAVVWDESPTPKDFVVRLEGNDYGWYASDQTGATNTEWFGITNYYDRGYRTLIRGSQMPNGSFIKYDGRHVYFLFCASPDGQLRVKYACIAPANSDTNYTMDAAAAGSRILFAGDHSGAVQSPAAFTNLTYSSESVTINAGDYAWGVCTNFVIDKSKSYLVSYVIDCSWFFGTINDTYAWLEDHSGAPGTYVLTNAVNATRADITNMNWSSRGPTNYNRIIGLAALYTLYPTNGVFTSQIMDTRMGAPVISNMMWTADVPSLSSLTMKLRTGDDPGLTNAAYTTVTAAGSVSPDANRYVQFQSVMTPTPNGWGTPKLKDVTISWPGEGKVVDVAAMMTKGPDYGRVELTVDGKPLVKGLRVDLAIYKAIKGWGKTNMLVTSAMSTEIQPRNTGR